MSWRGGGVRPFVIQRLTAVYIAVFVIGLIFHFVTSPVANFAAWHAWVASPMINVSFMAFCLAVLFHSWVGVRDVIMDYVHDDGLRFVVLALTGVFLLFMGLWSLKTLFMVSVA